MKHPKALYLLTFAKMWEFFSYYGNRALLVLYLTEKLALTDSHAYAIYAVYGGMVELSGILGGRIADKYLGLKRSCLLGGWLIAIGHLFMAAEELFFAGLAFVVVGTGLFATNIAALLGQFYGEEEGAREQGFTLFYMGMNGGAFIATLLCGYLAVNYGWHAGFGLAALGILIGNGTFLALQRRVLAGKGEPPIGSSWKGVPLLLGAALTAALCALSGAAYALPLLPFLTVGAFALLAKRLLSRSSVAKAMAKRLLFYLAALILFFAAEEQIGSSLMLFMERAASKTLFGIPMLPTTVLALNPLVIISCGTLMALLAARLKMARLPAAFLIAAAGFSLVACAPLIGGGNFPLEGVAATMLLISLAELLVGPLVFSYASEVAAKGDEGMVMAMVPISFSLASLLGGFLSGLVADEGGSLTVYGTGFGTIALLLLVIALIFWRFSYEKSYVYE